MTCTFLGVMPDHARSAPRDQAAIKCCSEASMGRSIALVTLVVRDYDEASAFFTAALRSP